jgi:hypothetical protein
MCIQTDEEKVQIRTVSLGDGGLLLPSVLPATVPLSTNSFWLKAHDSELLACDYHVLTVCLALWWNYNVIL